jgi:DedD protein
MRYTSQAAMDQQGLRDVDRWKDKIEVRLDNRQVAFLFFGSALVACMLFILGVIVGKRLESRGRALAPEIEDPLALLDRVAATTPPPAEAVPGETPAPVKPARVVKREPLAAVVPDLVEDEPASVGETPKPAEKLAEKPVARADDKTAEKTAEKAPVKTVAKPTAPPEVKSADIMPPSFETKPAPAAGPPAAPGAPVVATKDTGKKPRFMLQIGSFPDKGEAEAYASTFASERAIVVMSEIPGKGTWYRVRLGGFQAFQDAVDAKAVFERRYNKIALVVGPL